MATTRVQQNDYVVKLHSYPYSVVETTGIGTHVTEDNWSNTSADLLIQFDSVPDTIALHEITSATLYLYGVNDVRDVGSSKSPNANVSVYALRRPLLALSDKVSPGSSWAICTQDVANLATGYWAFPVDIPTYIDSDANNMTVYGVLVNIDAHAYGSYTSSFYQNITISAEPEHPAYLEIVTSASVVPFRLYLSPSSGYIDDKARNLFSWSYIPDNYLFAGKLTQSAATFQWRTKEAAPLTALLLTANRASLSMRALFPPLRI